MRDGTGSIGRYEDPAVLTAYTVGISIFMKMQKGSMSDRLAEYLQGRRTAPPSMPIEFDIQVHMRNDFDQFASIHAWPRQMLGDNVPAKAVHGNFRAAVPPRPHSWWLRLADQVRRIALTASHAQLSVWAAKRSVAAPASDEYVC
jgi:hypothetical protein